MGERVRCNYGNTVNQISDIPLYGRAERRVAPGEIIVVGVACTTTPTTNYFVECMSAHLHLERA